MNNILESVISEIKFNIKFRKNKTDILPQIPDKKLLEIKIK